MSGTHELLRHQFLSSLRIFFQFIQLFVSQIRPQYSDLSLDPRIERILELLLKLLRRLDNGLKSLRKSLENSLFYANLWLFREFLLRLCDIMFHMLQVLLYLRHIFPSLSYDGLKVRLFDLLVLPILIHVAVRHVFKLLIAGFD